MNSTEMRALETIDYSVIIIFDMIISTLFIEFFSDTMSPIRDSYTKRNTNAGGNNHEILIAMWLLWRTIQT